MRLRSRRAGAAAAAIVVLSGGAAYAGTRKHAGPRGDGTGVTPAGHRMTPAGTQVTLGLLPLASALSPDGSGLLVVNAGQGVQSLQVVDAEDPVLGAETDPEFHGYDLASRW